MLKKERMIKWVERNTKIPKAKKSRGREKMKGSKG